MNVYKCAFSKYILKFFQKLENDRFVNIQIVYHNNMYTYLLFFKSKECFRLILSIYTLSLNMHHFYSKRLDWV